MARVFNFGAGPAALPLPVLEKAQAELLEFNGSGMSLMEMSHRSAGFTEVIEGAEANVRKLMNVSDEYAVLFIQGGATLQFAMLAQNLMAGAAADYIHSGAWAKKAIAEAKLAGDVNVIWDGKDENYTRMPKADEYQETAGAAYVHVCTNETIGGVRFPDFPKTKAPLIADMSSEIMSRELDVNQFGMIYAGSQKNIGPSGLALVIIRKDLAERCPETVPTYLRYPTHVKAKSLYNTPNTWAIYMVKLVTDWLTEQGGVAGIQKINEAKAQRMYDALDASSFWKPVAQKECRSIMNVTWTTPSEELDAQFVKKATAQGMAGLKGHRSVGGLRASIYNACPTAAVDALIAFMKEFEAKNG